MTIYTLLCASLLTTIAFGMYSAIFKLGAQASMPASFAHRKGRQRWYPSQRQ
jgi:hypothetical protein